MILIQRCVPTYDIEFPAPRELVTCCADDVHDTWVPICFIVGAWREAASGENLQDVLHPESGYAGYAGLSESLGTPLEGFLLMGAENEFKCIRRVSKSEVGSILAASPEVQRHPLYVDLGCAKFFDPFTVVVRTYVAMGDVICGTKLLHMRLADVLPLLGMLHNAVSVEEAVRNPQMSSARFEELEWSYMDLCHMPAPSELMDFDWHPYGWTYDEMCAFYFYPAPHEYCVVGYS
ncbi:unnamed protein product [Prorocentrum cordatum]|uniref:Uncharacterized protein n=1 Tax=Prorocentrum cordatum TaxID=2364126 RepID=A0ABN9TKY0_9DINO|nr:unnamed protein product [Polarella glacialis]